MNHNRLHRTLTLILCMFALKADVLTQTPRDVNLAFHLMRNQDGSIGITQASILASVNAMNAAFTSANIVFYFLSVDTIQYGQVIFPFHQPPQPSDSTAIRLYWLWQQNRVSAVLNVYYLPSDANAHGQSESIPGRAIAVRYDYAANYAYIIHETGHALGLYHTFETMFGAEHVTRNPSDPCYNANNCGDRIEDTDADPYPSGNQVINCAQPSPETTDQCGQTYRPPLSNYMSYYYDCSYAFTPGQFQRMNASLSGTISDLVANIQVTVANKIGTQVIQNSNLTITGTYLSATIVSSGNPIALIDKQMYSSKTNSERLQGNNKHHTWDGFSQQYHLQENFSANRANPYRSAYFVLLGQVTIANPFIDGAAVSGATLNFNDPWYLNPDGSQGSNFFAVTTPYSPTGAFNQYTGGVFLGENQNFNSQYPYYSVSAPSPQVVGGFIGSFQSWSGANGTIIQNSGSAQTGVAFNNQGGTGTITANYLVVKPIPVTVLSAGGPNGQPVVVTWQVHPGTNVIYKVYRKVKHNGVMGDEQYLTTCAHNVTSFTDPDWNNSANFGYLLYYDVRAYHPPTNTTADPQWWVAGYGQQSQSTTPSITESPRDGELGAKEPVQVFELRNFPNPFNPTTHLEFALPEAGHVSVIVHDILGREIAVLARGVFEPGRYSVSWDGSSVGSGIYYARFLVRDGSNTMKANRVIRLLLMK